jgi:type III secretion protein T
VDLYGDLRAGLDLLGIDWLTWSAAVARVLPSVLLVPAFGLRALPAPTRIGLALALGATIAPALHPVITPSTPWVVLFVTELAKGLPVALSAAIALWAATMVGGLVDNLRGGREEADIPVVEQGATPVGILLAMLVAIAFLNMGGPAHIASALMDPRLEVRAPLEHVASSLAAGIQIAVAIAAPLAAVSIIAEIAHALVARAASPAYLQSVLAPFKAFMILGALALLLDRIAETLIVWSRTRS